MTQKAITTKMFRAKRPATLRYAKLLQDLANSDQLLKTDQLQAAGNAIAAINCFLREDPIVFSTDLGKALRILQDQITDVYNGSKKTIFNVPGKPGRPPTPTQDRHRGMIIYSLNILINAGMKNKEAGIFVTELLKNIKFKVNGNYVTTSQVLQWREQVGDTSPQGTDYVLGRLHNNPTPSFDLDEAKIRARAMIHVIARRNSN